VGEPISVLNIVSRASTYKNNKKRVYAMSQFRRDDPICRELLRLFSKVLGVKGIPFRPPNKPYFGWSDGNEGVQWNLACHTDTQTMRLGVNLEGMKYNGWPIARFITSEMRNPSIEDVRSILERPEEVCVQFTRDAWQVTARPKIVEGYLGRGKISFAQITLDDWKLILNEAQGCLDWEKNACGRAKQRVTLEDKPKKGDQTRIMEVSPHLTIWSPLSLHGNLEKNVKRRIAQLQPVYDWVQAASQ
jgi:hypothetical protein